jgi:magnesium transporter
MLPLTLIAGIFGMNVKVPGGHNIHAFWLILGLMVVVVAGMVTFFRRRGWL